MAAINPALLLVACDRIVASGRLLAQADQPDQDQLWAPHFCQGLPLVYWKRAAIGIDPERYPWYTGSVLL